jgi:hypothetical protein
MKGVKTDVFCVGSVNLPDKFERHLMLLPGLSIRLMVTVSLLLTVKWKPIRLKVEKDSINLKLQVSVTHSSLLHLC